MAARRGAESQKLPAWALESIRRNARSLNGEYVRQEIVNNPFLKNVSPRFPRTCRTLSDFWPFTKYEYGVNSSVQS
jgi:hypothetical protein